MQTIFAAFRDAADAERAAGALLDHGLKAEDISLLAHESYHQTWKERRSQANYTPPNEGASESTLGSDPLMDQPYAGGIATGSGVAATGLTNPVVDDIDIEGNPAEYVEGVVHPNRLGDTTYSAERPMSYPAGAASANVMWEPGDSTQERLDEIREHGDSGGEDLTAKSGISVTTGADAAAGAAKGAGVGFGVGVAAALAALFIPGLGLVIGSGALATAIAGAAATTAAGAVAGGVAGYLKDQGVPDDVLTRYNETFNQGGAVLAVTPRVDTPRAEVEAILAKYGALNVDTYGEQRFAS